MYYFDGHCDTLVQCFQKNETVVQNTGSIQIDKNGRDFVFAICLNYEQFKNPFENACRYIEFFNSQLSTYPDILQPILSLQDIRNKEGKTGILLALEGGDPLEGKLENIPFFYSLGIRLITLTWNYSNEIGFGHKENKGLLPFGFEAVKEMNRLGIVIDVSHLSDRGFWDVLSVSEKPAIASHSNCRAICPDSRNLTDTMLKALAEHGGLCGVNFYPPFLHKEQRATWAHVLQHIEYLINIMGEDHVGIGSDFDGIDQTPVGLEDSSCMAFLYEKTAKKYTPALADKIFALNYYRILQEIWRS